MKLCDWCHKELENQCDCPDCSDSSIEFSFCSENCAVSFVEFLEVTKEANFPEMELNLKPN